MSLQNSIKLYVTVSRWEFLPAVFIGILIGIFIGADSFSYLASPDFFPYLFEGLVIFIILFNVGFMVNCWADWKIDELYKTKLFHAVVEMGRNKLMVLLVLHIITAVILAVHLSIEINRIEIIALVWIGIFLGIGYSIEPFRFKKRGILHSLIALPIFFIPGVYSYFLVNSLPITAPYTLLFFLAAAGVTLSHYALILVSQAEDQPADKKMKIYTPAVTWGLQKTLRISFSLNLIGSIVLSTAIVFIFLIINIWLLILLPIIIVGRYLSMKEVYQLVKISFILSSENDLLKEIRKKMHRYPLWHAYGLTGITISSFCILLIKSIGWTQPFISA